MVRYDGKSCVMAFSTYLAIIIFDAVADAACPVECIYSGIASAAVTALRKVKSQNRGHSNACFRAT